MACMKSCWCCCTLKPCTICHANLLRARYQVLKLLYDNDILTEDALLAWADEKAEASAEDKVFLQKVCMLQRLRARTAVLPHRYTIAVLR